MRQKQILNLLRDAGDGFVSGEAISKILGVSRVAVWKHIQQLREQGYRIEAVTNRGYHLTLEPDRLELQKITDNLTGCPWKEQLQVQECVSSTNTVLKTMAEAGAPHGAILLANEQSDGRGRSGKSFASPKGAGLYYSLLLRPDCASTEVSHVTAMAAVAACDAIEEITQFRPGIKWTNDLVMGGKKVVGILTEMSAEWESQALQYLVIGIGINCNHKETDFPEDVRPIATSLSLETGHTVDRCALAAALTRALFRMDQNLLTGKRSQLERYKKDCITLGRQVRIVRGQETRTGTAMDLDENGGLIVRYDSGETGVVYSGEVSVRGLCGYT